MTMINVFGPLFILVAAACSAPDEPMAPLQAEASASRSPVPHAGEICGGLAGVKCAKGLYCSYAPEALCGRADAAGTCEERPTACTREYAPVCGCDGRTYANTCVATANGVSVAYTGECAPPVAHVGERCGGFSADSSPVCAEGLYCNYAIGDACGQTDVPGTCEERPKACIDLYAPVCGCDGQTYSNTCYAASNGVAVLHDGACE